jgi:hypothetical protein
MSGAAVPCSACAAASRCWGAPSPTLDGIAAYRLARTLERLAGLAPDPHLDRFRDPRLIAA